MSNEAQQFSNLVKDLITYLREEQVLDPPLPNTRSSSITTLPKASSLSEGENTSQLTLPTSPQVLKRPGNAEIRKIQPTQSSFHTPNPDPSMRQLVSRALPNLRLTSKTLDDTSARASIQLSKKNAPHILLLAQDPSQISFLKTLAQAIQKKFLPTKICGINRVEHAESVRLFIATHACAITHPAFKESPQPSLFGVPLILLAPIPDYKNNLLLKRTLWNQLCQILR